MDKSLFKEPKIVNSIFEFRFYPVEDIHRLVSDFESNLMSIFENKAIETMVPVNSSPLIPRFILSGKNRVLEVAPVSAVYKSNPENLTCEEAIKIYQVKTRIICQYLSRKNDKIKIEMFKSVNVINYALKDINYPLENDIFDNYFKIVRPGDFESVRLSIVRKTGDISFTNEIGRYEKRDVEMPKMDIKAGHKIGRIPISDLKISEAGLINSITIKQDFKSEDPKEIGDLFNKMLTTTIEKVKDHADEFIFRGNNV